jgi:hypothetical protein
MLLEYTTSCWEGLFLKVDLGKARNNILVTTAQQLGSILESLLVSFEGMQQ